MMERLIYFENILLCKTVDDWLLKRLVLCENLLFIRRLMTGC